MILYSTFVIVNGSISAERRRGYCDFPETDGTFYPLPWGTTSVGRHLKIEGCCFLKYLYHVKVRKI